MNSDDGFTNKQIARYIEMFRAGDQFYREKINLNITNLI